LFLTLAACDLNEFGPWLDESGQPLEGSQVIQYQGFEVCGHAEVVFLVFFGDMYAKDLDGVLGELRGETGETLTYAVLDEIPPGAVGTGIKTRNREIYMDQATRSDYLYIHRQDGRTERWPRAESSCDRPGSSS
jgi:hypothetical protein